MPMEGGRPIRGYRPSRFGLPEEECEEAETVRLSNVDTYARRVSAGLPIFEDVETAPLRGKPSVTAE